MRFLVRLVLLPVRIVLGVVRRVGFLRVATLAVGAAVGMLLAPERGAELRERLRRELERRRAGSDTDVARRVRLELSHNPRTWHLPQPTVSAEGGRVTLTGQVPDAAVRDELVRVATGVAGVHDVVDALQVGAPA